MFYTYPVKENGPNSKPPRISRLFAHFFKKTSGATSLEYSLIIAGIAVAIIITVSALGKSSYDAFKKLSDEMASVTEDGSQTGDSGYSDAGGSSGGGGSGSGSGHSDAGGPSGGGGSGSGSGHSDAGGSSGGSSSASGSGHGDAGGSGDRSAYEDAMYAATSSIGENQDYGIAGGDINSETSSSDLSSSSSDTEANKIGNSDLNTKNQVIIFKVQIISSSTRLKTNSPRFKGLKNVWEYKENGLYKYTVGNENNLKSAYVLQSELRKKGFVEAFVVAFKNGKRIPVKEAMRLLN